jgi:hypothetical protein
MKTRKNTFAKSVRPIETTIFLAVILCGSIGAVGGIILPFNGIVITTLKLV